MSPFFKHFQYSSGYSPRVHIHSEGGLIHVGLCWRIKLHILSHLPSKPFLNGSSAGFREHLLVIRQPITDRHISYERVLAITLDPTLLPFAPHLRRVPGRYCIVELARTSVFADQSGFGRPCLGYRFVFRMKGAFKTLFTICIEVALQQFQNMGAPSQCRCVLPESALIISG